MGTGLHSRTPRAFALAVLLLLCFSSGAWGSESFWQAEASRAVAAGAPQPTHYRVVRLDHDQMAFHLAGAQARGMATQIAIPHPDAGFSQFTLVDSEVLPPGLQERFPEIRSFQGLDEAGRRARVDMSPLGFQAMVFDPAGIWVVRPENFAGTDRHLVFRRSQLPGPTGLGSCRVHDGPVASPQPTVFGSAEPQALLATGTTHRLYRAAVAANNRYIAAVGGGTVAGGLAATAAVVNRVNEVYGHELSIQLQLVSNNELLMFPEQATDPFKSNGSGVINISTSTINSIIGSSNYDIGHVLTTGSGGVAGLGVVCRTWKGDGTTGLPDPNGDAFYVDYVAHEMGHQFGANHPFNGTRGGCTGNNRNGPTAYEPGSGSTVMAYAGICSDDNLQWNSDPYFHAISLQEISNYVSAGGNCSVNTPNPNQPPIIDFASLSDGHTIPAATPFWLVGEASDPDLSDQLGYSWEQWDLGPARALSQGDTGSGPIFRTWPPQATGIRYFPSLSTVLGHPSFPGEILPTTNRDLNFRLTVRDRTDALLGSGTSTHADVSISVSAAAGPFRVNTPVAGATLFAGGTETISWDVAGTNLPPVNCADLVVEFSDDGGQNFPHFVGHVPNTGSASVEVPMLNTNQARLRLGCADNIFFNVSPGGFSIRRLSIGGGVTGLGVSSVLQLQLQIGSQTETHLIENDGPYQFQPAVLPGQAYEVDILSQQPADPHCLLRNRSGIVGTSAVTDVHVRCIADYIFADDFDE